MEKRRAQQETVEQTPVKGRRADMANMAMRCDAVRCGVDGSMVRWFNGMGSVRSRRESRRGEREREGKEERSGVEEIPKGGMQC